jgi:dolichol kinase
MTAQEFVIVSSAMESVLWISLCVMSLKFRGWVSVINFICCCRSLCWLQPKRDSSSQPTFWRTASKKGRVSDITSLMSCSLVSLIFQALSDLDEYWIDYARFSVPIHSYPTTMLYILLQLLFPIDQVTTSLKSFIFIGSWLLIFHSIKRYSKMIGVWTFDEWTVVSCFLSVFVTEICTTQILLRHTYPYVAMVGTMGCIISCALAAKMQSLGLKLAFSGLLPFLAIEAVLSQSSIQVEIPRSLNWLLKFLIQSEKASVFPFPRYWWLLYWILILIVMMPISLCPSFMLCSPHITRKWFHLIAVFLFVPPTLHSPEMMALCYAIAINFLLILESVRSFFPKQMQQFYTRLLDNNKDKAGCVVVSHMALISGCAFPLWVSLCVDGESHLMKLWGVIVLGLGDSAAAIVGSKWGSTYWGYESRRTLEGSLAMLITVGISCSLIGESCLLVVFFTTLLEACTIHIDNLVLPLAGTGLLLFLKTPHSSES